ncbi:MAG: hypothetical protein J6H31_14435 [Butyrivibrio sp.]|nr:hypothetical protein [Butyrivibrio sp.]
MELQAKLLQDNRGGVIGHFDVPDVDKAKLYYKNFSKETVEKYRSKIRSIFAEGSYWHDMERFLLIGQRLGLKVEIRDTNCYYRSDIIIHVD